MPTLLLTGGSGLLALNWARVVAGAWSVHRAEHRRRVVLSATTAHLSSMHSDDEIERLLDASQPDLVVNCAGMTSVEVCEADPEGAHEANVVLPARLAKACGVHGIGLVHISTDHLFDDRTTSFSETDRPAPLNVYGRTKADGEQAVLAACPAALVARTNFFGWGTSYRASFTDFIIAGLRTGKGPLLFDDVHFTPILIDDLVGAIHRLVACGAQGLYHTVGEERLSKYAFGCAVANAFGLDGTLLRKGTIADRPDLVQRPRQMGLANGKMRARLGSRIGTVAEQLGRLAARETDHQVKELQQL
jgi:dTDP-4-dehydrorhamnose reductase